MVEPGPRLPENRNNQSLAEMAGRGHRRQAGASSAPSPLRQPQAISPTKWFVRFVVVAGLTWCAWLILADTAAFNDAADGEPEVALAWRGTEAAALEQRAYAEVTKKDGDLDLARGLAKRSMVAAPLNARALSVLALVAERKGEGEHARQLMQFSDRWSRRDVLTQFWLIGHDLREGRRADALQHVDVVMRTHPDLGEQLFPVIAQMASDQGDRAAVVAFLAGAPPWREKLLMRFAENHLSEQDLNALFAKLKSAGSPFTRAETRPYLVRLINDQRFNDAYQVWRASFAAGSKADVTTGRYLNNVNFARPFDGTPFDWQLDSVPGADIAIVETTEDREPALQIQFSGARVDMERRGQLLMLPPGSYRFSGVAAAEEVKGSRGVWWHLLCAEAKSMELGHTGLINGTLTSAGFALDFTVPLANCSAQWLRVEVPARIPSEKEIEGVVWYKHLRIAPIEARAEVTP